MLVAPSDHVIPDADGFRSYSSGRIASCIDGQIVTFGIRPDRAETGYGWLELTSKPSDDFAPVAQPLSSFVEKPNAEAAEVLLEGGMHLWNAGIFLFSTSTILKAFEQHAQETLSGVRDCFDKRGGRPWLYSPSSRAVVTPRRHLHRLCCLWSALQTSQSFPTAGSGLI